MIAIDVLINFLIALAIGALVGLEREYARYKKRVYDYAGIRTFPLIALSGAIAAYLGELISIWVFIVSIFLMGTLIIVAYFTMVRRVQEHMSATSEIAGFITFFLGALTYYGEITLAVTLAVVMTIILYSKSFLHHFAEKMKKAELSSTLKFAVVAFVILPFLPNQDYGPLGIFNPFIFWLMVVFISGIGFAGYILMKWFGDKGVALAGILGGLISSMAVTTSFTERSKKERKIHLALVLGVILANGIMFSRILFEVFVLNRNLFLEVLIPLLSLAIISAGFSYYLWKKAKKIKGKVQLGSPFTLSPALKFGIFFAAILALVKIANVYLSSKGVYLVSLISGLVNVDAITVSLSQLAGDSLSLEIAKRGILIAALTNVAVKGGIAYWFGEKQFGKAVLGFFTILILVGIGIIFLV